MNIIRGLSQPAPQGISSFPYQECIFFQESAGQRYLAKVDNLLGYHQLRLDKESIRLTAIISLCRVCRFLACPFGISTAQGDYEACMTHKM